MPAMPVAVPYADQRRRSLSLRIRSWIIALLLIAGVYAPTSVDEVISKELLFASSGLLFVVLLGLLMHRHGSLGRVSLVCAAVIVFDVLICTLLSPFTEFAYGAVRSFALLALLYCVRVKDIPLNRWTRRLFLLANFLNIACALAIMAQIPEVNRFFIENYAAAYQELVQYMLDERKPVLTFASHALAGFFFYVFFYLNLESYRRGTGRTHLVLAFLYVALMICLRSVSGYAFAVFAMFHLTREFFWNRSVLTAALAGLMLVGGAAFAATQIGILDFQQEFAETLTSESNGLNGRYSSAGVLTRNLNFLAEYPFSPIGLGFSDSLFYGDSGPVEYWIRGSFPLVIATYLGLYLFLRDNLCSRKQARLLFAVFLAFEVGYSNLHYLRTLFLLPFIVVYLNGIGQTAAVARPRLRYREAPAC